MSSPSRPITGFGAGSAAFAITGRGSNGSTGRGAAAGTRGESAVTIGGCERRSVGSSAWRSRWIARACSCDTLDSFTPSSAPICFIVTSP
jgi:hypothetical protein